MLGIAVPAADGWLAAAQAADTKADTPTPPQHTLNPAKPPPEAPAKPPVAAPRTPVQQVKPTGTPHTTPPVVKPAAGAAHVQTHAQKPGAPAAATKAPATTATKPPPATAVSPAPAVVPQTAAPAEKPPEPVEKTDEKGDKPSAKLPRFAALRSDEVNMRAGPGTRYPIEWTYRRRDLPVEIEREFEVWRLIVDPDGVKGWVHQATLTGRRTFLVTGAERVLRHDPNDTAAPVARLKPGVIGHIRSCDAGSDWCQMQVGDYRGYLKRDEFWGTLPNEAVTN
jgi:SH3-like domain-containing protein